MPTTAEAPWFVAEKRARKADQIARQCLLLGIDAARATRLTDEERRQIEVDAGVQNKGSDRTWRSVIEMLAGSAMPGALCLTCGMGDPEGEDGPRKPFGHEGLCAR